MEKLTELEARQKRFERDYAHEVTIFKGVIGAQGIDIKEIKIDVRDINQRLESMQEDIINLKVEVGSMKTDMGSMKAGMEDMKADIKQILALLATGKSEL